MLAQDRLHPDTIKFEGPARSARMGTMDDGRQGDQEATGSLLGLFEDGTGYGVQDRQLDWIAFRVS